MQRLGVMQARPGTHLRVKGAGSKFHHTHPDEHRSWRVGSSVIFMLKLPGQMGLDEFAKNSFGNKYTNIHAEIINNWLESVGVDRAVLQEDLAKLEYNLVYETISINAGDHGSAEPLDVLREQPWIEPHPDRVLPEVNGRPKGAYVCVTGMTRNGRRVDMATMVEFCAKHRLPLCEMWVAHDLDEARRAFDGIKNRDFLSEALYPDAVGLLASEGLDHTAVLPHDQVFGSIFEGFVIRNEYGGATTAEILAALARYRDVMSEVDGVRIARAQALKMTKYVSPVQEDNALLVSGNDVEFATGVFDGDDEVSGMMRWLQKHPDVWRARTHVLEDGSKVVMIMFTKDDVGFSGELAARDTRVKMLVPSRGMVIWFSDKPPSQPDPTVEVSLSKTKTGFYCATTMGMRGPAERRGDCVQAWTNVKDKSGFNAIHSMDEWVRQWAEYVASMEKFDAGRYLDIVGALAHETFVEKGPEHERPLVVIDMTGAPEDEIQVVAAGFTFSSKGKKKRAPLVASTAMIISSSRITPDVVAVGPTVVMIYNPDTPETNVGVHKIAALNTQMCKDKVPFFVVRDLAEFAVRWSTEMAPSIPPPTPKPRVTMVFVIGSTTGQGKSTVAAWLKPDAIVASDTGDDFDGKLRAALNAHPGGVVFVDKCVPDGDGAAKLCRLASHLQVEVYIKMIVADELDLASCLERVASRTQLNDKKPRELNALNPNYATIVREFFDRANAYLPIAHTLPATVVTSVFRDASQMNKLRTDLAATAPISPEALLRVVSQPPGEFWAYALGIGDLHVTMLPPVGAQNVSNRAQILEAIQKIPEPTPSVLVLDSYVCMCCVEEPENKVWFWTVSNASEPVKTEAWQLAFGDGERAPHVSCHANRSVLRGADISQAAAEHASRKYSRFKLVETTATNICVRACLVLMR